jgi:hypothetical protein
MADATGAGSRDEGSHAHRRRDVLIVVLVALAWAGVIALRRPDVFTRPQFWAEDGTVWYAQAYNHPGIARVVEPYGGYLQLVPRIAGLASQLVDFTAAPLLMAVLALLVQTIAPVFLLSDRFAWAVPRRGVRIVLAALLVAVPNQMEVHVNVSNSQVHLALLAFLVLLAEPRAARAWRAFDATCLLASGFSGPFCILLLPVALLCWWHRRDRWSFVRLACVAIPALVQVAVLARSSSRPFMPTSPSLTPRARTTPYGATPGNLLRIFGGQIVVGSLAGWRTYAALQPGTFTAHPWLPALLGLAGVALLLRAALVSHSFALRLLLLFATLNMSAALASPMIFGGQPLWVMLQIPGAGQRYWYSMTLAFLVTIVWTAAADPRRAMRALAALLLTVLVLVGIRRDFVLPPRANLDFPAQAERLTWSPPGKVVRIAILPVPFTMALIRGCEPPRVPLPANPKRAERLRARRSCPDR